MNSYTEDALIEQPAIALLGNLGWETINCFEESFGVGGTLGRETSAEVVLVSRLRLALVKLNPTLPTPAIDLAIEELTRERVSSGMVHANHEIYKLLKDGLKVLYRDENGEERGETVRVVDWTHPLENDFLLASQFWISGEMHKRRADLIGFVNGIPLLFIELKASHKNVEDAYQKNLRDYKDTIPHLFWYNGLLLLSNGSHSRLGSITSKWEHFSEWKKINSEGEAGVISLETMLRGICEPSRLLDTVENFILFQQGKGGLQKIIAKNHQFLGVNNSFDAVQKIRENEGKLGVFWHTQGSGKSFSMVFFAQKVLRKLQGNWTFLVVTDRTELDDQIYKNFADVGAVKEPKERVRAESGEHLKQLLTEDHRYIFTLIHKFYTENGQTYPALTQRNDIIVMTDEAHRSQYDVLALNMRNALPNAAFIGFTGTPLMTGEERTKQVFGDYVSIYNFRQSVEDGATVPLYYENRIPELQLVNQQLNQDMERLLEDAELDEAQERKLEREFSREYHLITRDDRLEKIAEDIVVHFMGRGFHGKAMVVAVDKATAIRMYNKVKKYWNIHLATLQAELETCDPLERPELEAKIQSMQTTDMAVVISQGQNEIDDMRQKGLDIRPHRKRMLDEDLDTKFKDENDPLRIAFVCAMWMTGFDVPSCSTIYLDKPMRNHTLMQTIARANRVFGEKVNGLIVDYIGIFRDLQKALAIYGSAVGGEAGKGEMPVEIKAALVDELRDAIKTTKEFLAGHNVKLGNILSAEGFLRVRLLDEAVKAIVPLEDAADAILVNDNTKQQYLSHANKVELLFQAILPDVHANEFGMDRKAIVIIADKIRSLTPSVDISVVMGQVDELLDQSIAPKGYKIRETKIVNLSDVDFEKLKQQFEKSRKHIEIEKLRGQINSKLVQMLQLNKSRMDFYEQFQKLIAEYNSGAKNADAFFAQLITFAQSLNEEEKRSVAESLNEEELALFDILTRPNIKLSRKEKEVVKNVAKDLLNTLKTEKLVLDWRKKQQTRAGVQLAIEQVLEKLPQAYSDNLYKEKCGVVYQHVYDSYYGMQGSVYS